MRQLIIDTDCGLDDASAILLALSQQDTRVLAITTVDGNTSLDNVVQNVLRVLQAANRQDIPVYRGSETSLLNLPRMGASEVHGHDGLGDFEHHEPVSTDQLQSEHAVCAIVRLLRLHQDLELICLGPLTNLAMAIRLDPGLGTRLSSLCIMGGNYKGIGNTTLTSEYNFYRDPEAAHVVLHDLKGQCHVTLVGWEVCNESSVSYETFQALMQADTKKATFMRNIYAKAMRDRLLPKFVFCDDLAVACFTRPEVITRSVSVRFRVELGGHWCRGMAVPDWEGVDTGSQQPLVTVVTEVDVERSLGLIRSSLNS